MARREVQLAPGTTILITKNEHGPQRIYELLPTARRAFIVTYNLPKPGGALLDALEHATQLETLRLVTNIPNWWESYWSYDAKMRAREAIQSSIGKLNILAQRHGAEIYFTRTNHSKIYVLDDVAYVGSSNFSDESANNVEAGVLIENQDEVDELRHAAWDLLKVDIRLHPTIADAAAASLEDWLREELQFENIYRAVHDSDLDQAQHEFQRAVKRLLELAHRAETVLDDARDPHWAEPLQSVIREATSLDEIGQVVGNLEYRFGKIQSCIEFSFQAAVAQHVVANCSDEETLEWWQEDGRRVAEEEWEVLRTAALTDLRRVVDVLEEVKSRVVKNLQRLQRPVDNTKA